MTFWTQHTEARPLAYYNMRQQRRDLVSPAISLVLTVRNGVRLSTLTGLAISTFWNDRLTTPRRGEGFGQITL
ncbi:unnamed protein product, partial [Iphiclides podalirius]